MSQQSPQYPYPGDRTSNDPVPGATAGPPPQAALTLAAQPRRIFGIQPVLFVGIVALAIVTLLTIVLIFAGDIGTQGPRVAWTVIAFLAFTGLLALDLYFSRRSAIALPIGVAANSYLLVLLMVATWVDERDDVHFLIAVGLFGVYVGSVLAVRAAAAAAWGLINLGNKAQLQLAAAVGKLAALLVGLSAVLLTMKFAFDAFGIELPTTYWQFAVSVLILAALGACVTVLLFWNRRNLEYEARKAAGIPEPTKSRPQGYATAPQGMPQAMQPPPGWAHEQPPMPAQHWQGQPAQHGQPSQQWQVPAQQQPAQPPVQQPQWQSAQSTDQRQPQPAPQQGPLSGPPAQ